MVSNGRWSQVSKQMVVAKDNFKKIQTQKVTFCKTKTAKQLVLTLNDSPHNGWVGLDHDTQMWCLELSPNGWMKKWNIKWWVMIDENNDCVTKSKLTLTVKTPSKYNDRRTVAAKQTKQTNKRVTDRKLKEQKDILTNRRTRVLNKEGVKQRVLYKNKKWGALCSVVIQINKEINK